VCVCVCLCSHLDRLLVCFRPKMVFGHKFRSTRIQSLQSSLENQSPALDPDPHFYSRKLDVWPVFARIDFRTHLSTVNPQRLRDRSSTVESDPGIGCAIQFTIISENEITCTGLRVSLLQSQARFFGLFRPIYSAALVDRESSTAPRSEQYSRIRPWHRLHHPVYNHL
jgi:hypothetical protein